jgi:hypothetical protein
MCISLACYVVVYGTIMIPTGRPCGRTRLPTRYVRSLSSAPSRPPPPRSPVVCARLHQPVATTLLRACVLLPYRSVLLSHEPLPPSPSSCSGTVASPARARALIHAATPGDPLPLLRPATPVLNSGAGTGATPTAAPAWAQIRLFRQKETAPN